MAEVSGSQIVVSLVHSAVRSAIIEDDCVRCGIAADYKLYAAAAAVTRRSNSCLITPSPIDWGTGYCFLSILLFVCIFVYLFLSLFLC